MCQVWLPPDSRAPRSPCVHVPSSREPSVSCVQGNPQKSTLIFKFLCLRDSRLHALCRSPNVCPARPCGWGCLPCDRLDEFALVLLLQWARGESAKRFVHSPRSSALASSGRRLITCQDGYVLLTASAQCVRSAQPRDRGRVRRAARSSARCGPWRGKRHRDGTGCRGRQSPGPPGKLRVRRVPNPKPQGLHSSATTSRSCPRRCSRLEKMK